MDTQKKKKRKLKPAVIVLIVLALIGAGVAAFFLLNRSGTDDYAYVQSVAEIIQANGGVVLSDRYSGVVEAKNTVKIRLEEDRTVDQCFVEVGDDVETGTPLFSYDIDKLQMTSQQLLIDYETLLNNITSYNDEIKSLEKQLKKAKASAKAELNVQLQTAKLNVMKAEYDAKEKKKALDEAEAIIHDNVVRATSPGTVRAINPPTSDNSGEMPSSNEDAYMVIVSNADFWVKGTISEQGAYQLSVGTPMTLRSRVDEGKTWSGSIVKVNTEQPVEREGYYSDSVGENTSKYAFYVSLDSTDDLMMGQHLYIEFGSGSGSGSGIRLLSSYLAEENGGFFAYAADRNDRIEKRSVSVGNYDEETDTYEITSGLSVSDRIAYPSEGIHSGMKAADPGYAAEASEAQPEEGMEYPEAEYLEEAEFAG